MLFLGSILPENANFSILASTDFFIKGRARSTSQREQLVFKQSSANPSPVAKSASVEERQQTKAELPVETRHGTGTGSATVDPSCRRVVGGGGW